MSVFNHWAALAFFRFSALVGMCVWLGGFTFYGGIVIPILDEAIGQVDTGMLVTRYVTKNLNLIGFSTVSLWWWLLFLEHDKRSRLVRWGRCALLIFSTVCLGLLILTHRVMEQHLDHSGLKDFKPLHRTYLMVSTIQWAANLGILGFTILLWTSGEPGERTRDRTVGSTPGLR